MPVENEIVINGRTWTVEPSTLVEPWPGGPWVPPESPYYVPTFQPWYRTLDQVKSGNIGGYYIWTESGGLTYTVDVAEYISTPRTANWDFGSSSFEITSNVYANTLSDGNEWNLINFYQDGSTFMKMYVKRVDPDYILGFRINDGIGASWGEYNITGTTGLFKVVRNGNNHYMYQNDTLLGNAVFARDPVFSSGYTYVGAHSDATDVGQMSLFVNAQPLLASFTPRVTMVM